MNLNHDKNMETIFGFRQPHYLTNHLWELWELIIRTNNMKKGCPWIAYFANDLSLNFKKFFQLQLTPNTILVSGVQSSD